MSTNTTNFKMVDGSSTEYYAPPNAPQDEKTVLFQLLLDGQIVSSPILLYNIHSHHEIRHKYTHYD